MNTLEFQRLLATVAHAWAIGDARLAADCFAIDALYMEPPDQQRYSGRHELFTFFGGDDPSPLQMSMVWHQIVFDEQGQIGFGEYTFVGGSTYHGVAVIALIDDVIASWREYQYRSDLDWLSFVGQPPVD